ncbi:MAG TPA: hypothetical protein VFE63_08800 [Roseiarcus sp.]|jgi:hypothetical protein|nr:hypothetical protein [Roseiarcus sp.]
MAHLRNGQLFPPIEIPAVGGGMINPPHVLRKIIQRASVANSALRALLAFKRAPVRFAPTVPQT